MKNIELSSWGLFFLLLLVMITYGLGTLTAVGSWIGHQNLDPALLNYTLTVAAVFLVIAFFMLLLPIWPELE